MKAQTKALVASVVVIALALSAVSGITYSWWSDTENSDITITTGDLDVSTSDITVGYTEEGETKTESVSYSDTLSISYGGANASSATVALDTSKVDPNDDVTISYAVTFKATVNVKYLLDVDVPTTFEDVTTTEVTSNGTTFSALGVYQEDTTNALDKTYSVVITISELPRNATGIFKLTNYITQLPNTDAQAGTQTVSEGSATVTEGDASVAVTSIPNDAQTLKVVTTTDDSANTASIYLTLTDSSGNKITDFDSAVSVEVVLKGAYNGLYYNGTEAQPTVSSYAYSTDKSSWGATFETAKYTKVTFTTTHFSEFVATSTVEVSDASALATAIAAGGYVKLGAAIGCDVVVGTGTSVVLDLNGFTLTNGSSDTIVVQAGASLIILDSTGSGGKVDNVTHGKAAVKALKNSTVVISGGTFERSKEAGTAGGNGGNSYYTIEDWGTMTINNAEIKNKGSYSSMIRVGYENDGIMAGSLTLNDCKLDGGRNAVKIEPGSTLVVNNGEMVNSAQYVIMNYGTATLNGGKYTSNGTTDTMSCLGAVGAVFTKTENNTVAQFIVNGGEFSGPHLVDGFYWDVGGETYCYNPVNYTKTQQKFYDADVNEATTGYVLKITDATFESTSSTGAEA